MNFTTIPPSPGGQVINLSDYYWSISRYHEILGLDRKLVARALGVCPFTERNGIKVFHVRDAMPAIYKIVLGVSNLDGVLDLSKLPPKARLDHFKAEREKIKLDLETKVLIPASDVESRLARVFKVLATVLDTLPDILERDCGLDSDKVTRLQEAIDSARESLYDTLVAEFTGDA